MAKPNTNETKTSAPAAKPKDDNTKPATGESTGPTMTRQEYEALTGSESQEKTDPAPAAEEVHRMGEISSAATLRRADPSRVEIAATIASGLVAHGRYAALLRDERMIHELALNSLRIADALIAAAEHQA